MTHLVLGGTGTVGSEVVRQLRERGEDVRVLTRSAENAAELPAGVEGVVGDLTDPDTYADIFRDFDTMFLLNAVSMTELHEGLVAFKEAERAGPERIVYLSVQEADAGPAIPHFAGKVAIENALKGSDVAYTILRPSNFFQNDYWFKDGMTEHGVYAQPLGSVGVSRVDVRDIAEAAANALTSAEFEGKTYTLVGPDPLTAEDCARIWGEALGRDLGHVEDVDAWAEQAIQSMPGWMVWDFKVMYRMFHEQGLLASDEDLRETERIVGHAPRSFEDWVAEVAPGWS